MKIQNVKRDFLGGRANLIHQGRTLKAKVSWGSVLRVRSCAQPTHKCAHTHTHTICRGHTHRGTQHRVCRKHLQSHSVEHTHVVEHAHEMSRTDAVSLPIHRTHTRTHTHTTHMCMYIYTYIHTCVHKYSDTHTYSLSAEHTHTHTPPAQQTSAGQTDWRTKPVRRIFCIGTGKRGHYERVFSLEESLESLIL